LPDDPICFGSYYEQQLLTIDWAREEARAGNEVFKDLNPDAPAGVAGHSMGGQSALFASSYANATEHNIAAAVYHHAYTHEYPGPSVPFLAFTGQLDYVALPRQTQYSFFDAGDANPVKGLSDRVEADHFEPEDDFMPWSSYNPLVPQYTAAWFKLHLENKRSEFGLDFHEWIYGEGAGSICGGDDGEMKKCDMRE
jgi:predicted alpha/beta hydrolase